MSELVKYHQSPIEETVTLSKYAVASGYFRDVGGEASVFSIMMYSRALGIDPWIALFGGMHVIKGKVELSSQMMNLLMRKAGHSIVATENTDKVCTIVGTRGDNGDTMTVTFTMDEAKKAGIAQGGSWAKYPSDMLFARAMSRLCRRLAPDVIGASYIEGEIPLDESPHKKSPKKDDGKNEEKEKVEEARVVLSKDEILSMVQEFKENLDVEEQSLADYLIFCQEKTQCPSIKDFFINHIKNNRDTFLERFKLWEKSHGK